MQHIILAFAASAASEKIKKMLLARGYEVYAVCRSKSELLRIVADIDDFLVITGFKLADATCDELCEDVSSDIIAIIKPEQNEYILSESVMRLMLPINSAGLCEAVGLYIKNDIYTKHERTPEDKQLVETAKLYLMDKYMMDEASAHRFIQKYSMDNGLTLAKTARRILKR